MSSKRPRDPETRAHEREIADHSNDYRVVAIHDPGTDSDVDEEIVLGELDETFSNDVDAYYAAEDVANAALGIRAESRIISDDDTDEEVAHVATG